MTEALTVLRMLVGRCGAREADVCSLIGQLYRRVGDLAQAQWFQVQTLAMNPAHAAAHTELGEVLRMAGHPQQALPHLEQAIALAPALAAPRISLAATLLALHRLPEALRLAREALDQGADAATAHGLLGDVLGRLGQFNDALSHYERALAIQPADVRARYGRGVIRLAQGDLPAAWTDIEARIELPAFPAYAGPRWRGAPLRKDQRILLHAERGLEDTIQFVRYAERVSKSGATVLLAVQRGMGRLCAGVRGVAQVVESGAVAPHYDLHCPLISLAGVFGTSLETIPADIPYLTADPRNVAEWQRALGPWKKMRVGFAWSSPGGDPSCAVPLTLLAPLLHRDDIACHVIQRGISADDRAALAQHTGLSDHSAALWDLSQTAALIAAMDLVIVADLVEAHLAGALGVPAWVMLAHNPDWRWLREREDSPWYPSLRLFRQTHQGDWGTGTGAGDAQSGRLVGPARVRRGPTERERAFPGLPPTRASRPRRSTAGASGSLQDRGSRRRTCRRCRVRAGRASPAAAAQRFVVSG